MEGTTWSRLPKRALLYGTLSIISLIMIFPFIWMILSALKTGDEIFAVPLTWFPESPQWQNFVEALEMAPFGLYIWNSIFTAVVIVLFQVVLSCMLAYALTQLKFWGQHLLFMAILASYMLPAAATYVPSYVILARLGLLDTLSGIIVSNIASVFCIFMIRQAFLQVPREMIEAARADGAGDWQILWKIMFPMAKSSIFTVALISFVQMYNNYLWPSLIVSSQEKYLITVGLRQFFTAQGTFASQWPLIMAANVFAVAPLIILFIVLQKWFVKGISDNGVKG
ncbi:carbohydrate ABC transporter permease [Alkalicoccobacillus plakortidis]|uniref:Carbohydrate ABC transporter permease n=1 Tax=Alkalicoccobacillus plakortidis TaxID=444060 RepID=A0ABT0XKA8_9BACI|nr:carbohydrate ABC transporter permease [Alkalicoccobacillus plakortidis]MCM2676339.1 carbohydrate ABC transporter permease [Alkalicoccobacillus plakortidis]